MKFLIERPKTFEKKESGIIYSLVYCKHFIVLESFEERYVSHGTEFGALSDLSNESSIFSEKIFRRKFPETWKRKEGNCMRKVFCRELNSENVKIIENIWNVVNLAKKLGVLNIIQAGVWFSLNNLINRTRCD